MKKCVVVITLIAILTGILLPGCAQNNGVTEAQRSAESFLKIYYTVDSQTTSDFNKSQINTLKTIGSKFKSHVLDTEMNSFIANRFTNYYYYIQYCAAKKIVMKPEKFKYKIVDKQTNSYTFQYVVTYSLTSENGTTSEVTSADNTITMTKDHDSWKMSYISGHNPADYTP